MSGSIHRTAAAASLRPLREADRDHVFSMWQRYYGAPNESYFDAAVGSSQYVAGFAAVVDGEVSGFAIASVPDVEWLEREYPNASWRDHLTHKLNGLLYQSVVAPPYRRRGIGSMLTRRRIQWLAGHDVELHHLIAVAWVRENGPDPRGILDRFGFDSVEYLEREFHEGVTCPDCEGGCGCDAEVYLADLGGESA